jgi:surface antigen
MAAIGELYVMSMKTRLFLLCIFSAMAFGAQELRSAGFPRGQCTWYAYLRAQESGWSIIFDKPYNRHAIRWWEKVTNAKQISNPAEGSVMVLDAWEGNPYGHVAYVEKVLNKNQWIVTHANFGLGSAIKELDGVKIYEAKCERTEGGVLLQGSKQVFKLRGFLSQPAPEK